MKKNTDNQIIVVKDVAKARKELQRIGEPLKGKELFKQKVDNAKKILAKIKSLPV
jgi:hypothetical protein